MKHNIILGHEYIEYKRANWDVFKCMSSLKLSARAAGESQQKQEPVNEKATFKVYINELAMTSTPLDLK